MTENFEKWSHQVSEAAKHAVKVYEEEVAKLQKKVAEADEREGREVQHVAKQVDRDLRYAEHHIAYLEKIVAKEDERVQSAHDRLVQRSADGASDKSISRAAEHVAKVEVSAEKRVERALKNATVEIERDATAAARHIVKGLEKIDEYEEDLGDEVDAQVDRVAKTLEKLNQKVTG